MTRFYVRVKTKCEEKEIQDFGNNRFLVHLTEVPTHNQANIELINALGKHLGIPPLKLKIVSGATSADKVLETAY
jgi:uncharacterized protein YggU (UPF0235/DUF167 family)